MLSCLNILCVKNAIMYIYIKIISETSLVFMYDMYKTYTGITRNIFKF